MKNLFRFSALAALCMTALFAVSCGEKELDTDQFSSDGVAIVAVTPNPVMRGGELTIKGSNLQTVKEVRFTGGVSVTDFKSVTEGRMGELKLIVPVEGPEVGPVTVVDASGIEFTSLADLEFTEPIVVDAFSPATALSGDVITIKGDYLNNIQEVIFPNDVYVTEFESQSRHELKVKVPASAVTGLVIVCDVNELVDANTIPNKIYTATALTIGDPTVVKAADATYKAGDKITVSGNHLDMIETVNLVGASDVEFTVSADAKTIEFFLPAKATDGDITLVSYAGNSFNGGAITTVTVASLAIESNAEDARYKAGASVTISGSDLDLVTKVEFVNAEAAWYLEGGKIIATIPDAAKDGAVTLTLESGKQASTPEITVVKPVAASVDKTEAKAGDVITVTGTDLDLVNQVTIGDAFNGLIQCEFELVDMENLGVTVPDLAYTGVLTLTAPSSYSTVTGEITVAFSLPVNIVFDGTTFQMAKEISFTGSNLLKIEQIFVKGKKITAYTNRTDSAYAFNLPEDLGPGVYRLDLVLTDGTSLTWPVPFEVTAPYTETFFWEGYEDLGDWSNQPFLGADGALAETLVIGDLIRIYYVPLAEEWQFQIFDGHWGGMTFPELGGGNAVRFDNTDPSATYFAFEVTEANYAALTTVGGWGGVLLTQGSGVAIKGCSVVHFGATETLVWEGMSAHTGDYATNLEIGGEDDWVNAGLTEGATVYVYFTPDDPEDWSIQLFDGHWGSLAAAVPDGQFKNENSPNAISEGRVSFVAEGDVYTALTTKQWWGSALIVQGKNLVVTKLTFM